MTNSLPVSSDNEITNFGIIGLGYVGLPLAVEAARSGKLKVIGFDVSEQVVKSVNSGCSHIQDLTDDEVGSLRNRDLIEATCDMSRLAECDAISICVPTPLSKTGDPDVSYVKVASEAVAAALHPGQLIVLESTTYPGTTREVLKPKLESTGLTTGEDFYLCFSPERVDPGNKTWTIRNTPKVIGGLTEMCGDIGQSFYEQFIDKLVRVSSVEAAELTKILENTFRAVNIGLVNEIALIADRLGVDVWETIEAAATKPFGFMKFTPGPGLGGHCIPVDPHYLSWKMRSLNYKTRFIDLASEVNSEMPFFVVDKVREVLNRNGRPLNGSGILLLGIAYKRDVDDIRESPALDVMQLLQQDSADIRYHDPYVSKLKWEGVELHSEQLTDALFRWADCVVILTDHSCFDYARILDQAKALVDTRHAVSGAGVVTDAKDGWIVTG
ncbi:MAG: nucleotide sugar dehydrogenase [Gemmatimonadetes bacterium]|nr:nucleotide sugar dehydrogenase [Gemmatimonadota bacterium]